MNEVDYNLNCRWKQCEWENDFNWKQKQIKIDHKSFTDF